MGFSVSSAATAPPSRVLRACACVEGCPMALARRAASRLLQGPLRCGEAHRHLLPASAVAAGLCLALTMPTRKTTGMAVSQDELKKQVGYKAVDDYVRSGMVVGLGTGSTAYFAVERVGQKLASGELKDIVAVPTSKRTQEQAASLGIKLATLDTQPSLDVAIDGADSVDRTLNLVKGGGGAHFREKIVEATAKTFVVIVDESKLCDSLGPHFPVPVEVVPFCHEHTARIIKALPALEGCEPVLRLGSAANNKRDGDQPAVTDNGNYILDLQFTKPIKDPRAAARQLKSTIGVVEHGFFTDMASVVLVAGKEGIYERKPPRWRLFSRL
ncbi:unnamed protein product [Effrenium voratum]|uniref:ribose-5-phosphate isomerase n=1 Tax=Effrenium voratum TaxID=2562239 RepID=A0AA36I0A7_9DINO|nr:unnamed protein product [Effrenium voratum]